MLIARKRTTYTTLLKAYDDNHNFNIINSKNRGVPITDVNGGYSDLLTTSEFEINDVRIVARNLLTKVSIQLYK